MQNKARLFQELLRTDPGLWKQLASPLHEKVLAGSLQASDASQLTTTGLSSQARDSGKAIARRFDRLFQEAKPLTLDYLSHCAALLHILKKLPSDAPTNRWSAKLTELQTLKKKDKEALKKQFLHAVRLGSLTCYEAIAICFFLLLFLLLYLASNWSL